MSSPAKRNRNQSLESSSQPPTPKRKLEDTMEGPSESSQFIPVFEIFRNELDEHHDRRERIIKASRDITASSKKVIFSLQRFPVSSFGQPVPEKIQKLIDPLLANIERLFNLLVPDLQGINAWRYQRQVSPGIQEYIEALAFRHYLTTRRLITPDEAKAYFPGGIQLTDEDWILGVFDTIGEMMRWSITGIATGGQLPGFTLEDGRNVLVDLRDLRLHLEGLNAKGSGVSGELYKKLDVMKTCVSKVENAAYDLAVRGSERPKGWVPESKDDGKVEVEGY